MCGICFVLSGLIAIPPWWICPSVTTKVNTTTTTTTTTSSSTGVCHPSSSSVQSTIPTSEVHQQQPCQHNPIATRHLMQLTDHRGPDSHSDLLIIPKTTTNPATNSNNTIEEEKKKISSAFLHPDQQQIIVDDDTRCSPSDIHLQFHASVLHLRGPQLVSQPYQEREDLDTGYYSTLLWNGEAFGNPDINFISTSSVQKEHDGGMDVQKVEEPCDTVIIYNELVKLEEKPSSSSVLGFIKAARDFLENVAGPFACIFFSKKWNVVLFCRDPIGRRSLVFHCGMEPAEKGVGQQDTKTSPRAAPLGRVTIASCCGCTEGSTEQIQFRFKTKKNPTTLLQSEKKDDNEKQEKGEEERRTHRSEISEEEGEQIKNDDISCLEKEVSEGDGIVSAKKKKTSPKAVDHEPKDNNAPSAADRFCWSEVPIEGVYWIPLATPECEETCSSSQANPTIKKDEGIDFLPNGKKYRATTTFSTIELEPWKFLHNQHPIFHPRKLSIYSPSDMQAVISVVDGVMHSVLQQVHYDFNPQMDSDFSSVTKYLFALSHSIYRRVSHHCLVEESVSHPISLLFSGGIDSTVLAALSHFLLPLSKPIELLNVAFGDYPEETPDRISARHAIEELRNLPHGGQERDWRLVDINVSHQENDKFRQHVLNLVYPCTSVMDLNIGCAIWFATRGIGHVILKSCSTSNTTTAKHDEEEGDVKEIVKKNEDKVVHGGKKECVSSSTIMLDRLWRVASVAETTTKCTWRSQETATNNDAVTVDKKRSKKKDEEETLHGNENNTKDDRNDEEAGSNNNGDYDELLEVKYKPLLEVLIQESVACDSATTTNSSHQYKTEKETGGSEVEEMDSDKVVVNDEVTSSTGSVTRVLLSTLGKDYTQLLTPHWRRYGCRKLGNFLNDAEKSGLVKLSSSKDRKVKYVSLVRPCDLQIVERLREENDKRTASLVKVPYQSQGRVVILGMGADETLGGYVRHQRKFSREGSQGLQIEMEKDFQRLWQRNLGRDDRIVSDHGREGRYPFLDEEVLSALSQIPLQHVCSLDQGAAGIGDKIILRTLARRIGLTNVSRLQKRAIQFGTRIANRKVQGNVSLMQLEDTEQLYNPMVSKTKDRDP